MSSGRIPDPVGDKTRALRVSNEIMDVVDTLGTMPHLLDMVDKRSWEHLLIYAPKACLLARLAQIEKDELEDQTAVKS